MNNFNENQNVPFYPEPINFNVQTQSFQPTLQASKCKCKESENQSDFQSLNANFEQTQTDTQQRSSFQNPLFNLLKNQNGGLSNLFGGNNDMLSAILSSGLFGNGQKNNMFAQALNILQGNKKQTEEHTKKVIDIDNSFEEM